MSDLHATDVRAFIPALDFALSQQFYAALGWKVKRLDSALALVEFGEQHFYIQNYYVKEIAENTMLHITVADARAWHEHVSRVLHENRFGDARVQAPKVQAYGALVTFVHDPSGVLLHFCQWQP